MADQSLHTQPKKPHSKLLCGLQANVCYSEQGHNQQNHL